MKSKFKLSYIKHQERGFAIPLALGVGLLIILAAISLIAKSQKSRTTTIAQTATAKGLSAAEIAINRYIDIMDKYRPIATYCSGVVAGEPACNTGTTWANISGEFATVGACNTTDNTTAQQVVQQRASANWQDLNPSDASQGQFKLINYVYKPDDTTKPNQAPGRGILTLEGRVNQQGSGSTATKDNAATATSRIQVEIPIEKLPPNEERIPGVWVDQGGTGNNTFQADVFVGDCNVNLSTVKVDSGYTAKFVDMEFPDLPDIPSTWPNNLGNVGNTDITLPRAGDTPTTKTITKKVNGQTVQETIQVYEYKVDSITGQAKVNITPGQRVTFYLFGDISPSGNGEILHSCVDSSGNSISGCSFTNFQVFAYGPGGTKTTPKAGQVCSIGNKRLDLFLLGPEYIAGVAGAGSGGGVYGSIWVKDWSNASDCGSNTNNVVVRQTATWDDLGLVPKNVPPRLKPISAWRQLESGN